jgi:acid stress chaperone HdeA
VQGFENRFRRAQYASTSHEGNATMKFTRIALPLIVFAAWASIAAAVTTDDSKKKPVKSWTCADFLGLDNQFKPKMIYAASAYSTGGKLKAAVIDIDGTEKVTPMIVDDCSIAPQSSFMRTLKNDWSKVRADAKAEMKKIDKKL